MVLQGDHLYLYRFHSLQLLQIFYLDVQNIDQIAKQVKNIDQTLTYFGINKSVLKNFILKNKFRGIDRIVPIGQALNISLFWDGYDLNKILTRVVDIK